MSFPFLNNNLPDESLSLDSLLVRNKASTFFMRVDRDFESENIRAGDILIVDRSLKPVKSSIVVGIVNGDFVLLRVSCAYKIKFPFIVWGVVTYVIRKVS